MSLNELLQTVLKGSDTKVSFRSSLTPHLTLYDANAEPTPPSPAARFVNGIFKPSLVVESEFGTRVIAPYGLPEKDLSPHALVISAVILSLAAYGAFDLASRLRR